MASLPVISKELWVKRPRRPSVHASGHLPVKAEILSSASTELPTSSAARLESVFHITLLPSSYIFPQNTNVVELYSHLEKNSSQLTYYDSGIGTYVKPSWTSLSYFVQLVDHSVDMAIAWLVFSDSLLTRSRPWRLIGISKELFSVLTSGCRKTMRKAIEFSCLVRHFFLVYLSSLTVQIY